MKKKSYPNKANGARKVNEIMKARWQDEMMKEIFNELYSRSDISEDIDKVLTEMALKRGILPIND